MGTDWELRTRSLNVMGDTRRERLIRQTQRNIKNRIVNNPAYKTVLVDGVEQELVITSSTEMWHKKIDSMPNERIYMGSIVEWNGRHFLIVQTDCDYELVQRGEMYECNVYIKWQNEKGEIIGRYGYTENLSQFSSGTVESRIMQSIQQVYHVMLPLDEETIKLRRDRRFLIGVSDDKPNAYVCTRRDVVTNNFTPEDISEITSYKDKIISLALSETQLSEKDNTTLMIADYFEPDGGDEPIANDCKIIYKGKPTLRLGGSSKTFNAEFYNSEGESVPMTAAWYLITKEEDEGKITLTTDGNTASLSVVDDTKLLGTQCQLILTNTERTCEDTLYVKVVSVYG